MKQAKACVLVPSKITAIYSTKPWKTQRDTDWDGASLGWVRGLNTTSMPADRAQANQGVGKVPRPIPASLWDTPAWKLGKALSTMASRQNGARDQTSQPRNQQAARPHSVHWWLSHQRPVRVGLHCQGKVRPPSIMTVQPVRSQPPAGQWR